MSRQHRINNWINVKKKWRKENPPTGKKDGKLGYICWICEKFVAETEMTIDHVLPVKDYPEYATNLSNFRPSHGYCNKMRDPNYRASLKRFIKRSGEHGFNT